MSLTIDFSDRTVVVIGGTSGINRGVAELFAQHGARVAVASRSDDKVKATVESLQALGAEAMGFCADVRDLDAIEAGLARVHEKFGDFDVLVSGAAGNFPATVNGMSANAFRSVVEIDLMGRNLVPALSIFRRRRLFCRCKRRPMFVPPRPGST
jgi:NAD(P)-dependent dehydrogenase (short-subunit alcohol dehydrogenase family)